VIGGVDIVRRDYNLLFKAFKGIVQRLATEVELIFLGKVFKNSQSVINKFKSLSSSKFSFKYFNSYVPDDEFVRIMKRTHFIIIPMKEIAKSPISTEYYGRTKISGNINDMIKYSKAAILPDFYRLDNNLKSITRTYFNSDSLSDTILYWINEKPYLDFDFDDALNDYRPHMLRKELINQIYSAIVKTN